VMTFKSGFTNENNAVRWVRAPGPLREAAGFSYQEFSNLEKPLALKDDPFHAGAENKVSYWAEFLMPEHAKPLAYYDHPFYGKWPAITENQFGSGSLTYLTDTLQKDILLGVLKEAGLAGADQSLPGPVRLKQGVNAMGKRVHYYLNYSSDEQAVAYSYGAGTDLTTGGAVTNGQSFQLKPWDLAIVEEK
jgi:beta-galactosidase